MSCFNQSKKRPSRPPVGIHSLAIETLTDIIQLALDTTVSEASFPNLSSREWFTTPAHSGIVGFSLVCRAWRNIIVNTSSLWTRIILYIDSPRLMSSNMISTLLSRSKNRPLSVFLFRKEKMPYIFDLRERYSVTMLLAALSPDFHRVSTLFIETYQSSSLPDATSLMLRGHVCQLKSLILRSATDDSILFDIPTDIPSSQNTLSHQKSKAFGFPPLESLCIDGFSLLRVVAAIPDLQVPLQHLRSLAVTHLTFRAGSFSEERIQAFFDIVSALPRLQVLAFDGFEVNPAVHISSFAPRPLVATSIDILVMTNVGIHSMEFILACITNPTEVVLVECAFTRYIPLPSCSRLKIVDAADISRSVIMAQMVIGWKGRDLEISSFTPLRDNFWYELLACITFEECLPNLRSIKISDSPGFLPRAFAYFVEWRKKLGMKTCVVMEG